MIKIFTTILLCMNLLFACCQYRDSSAETIPEVVLPLPTPEDPSRMSEREYAALMAIFGDSNFVIQNSTTTDSSGDVSIDATKRYQGLLPETIADYNKNNHEKKRIVSVDI